MDKCHVNRCMTKLTYQESKKFNASRPGPFPCFPLHQPAFLQVSPDLNTDFLMMVVIGE